MTLTLGLLSPTKAISESVPPPRRPASLRSLANAVRDRRPDDGLRDLAELHRVDGLMLGTGGGDGRLRALAIAAELVRSARALQAAGVAALAFKGAALAVQAYGDPLARRSDDVDLLVAPASRVAAVAALVGAGYTVVDGDVNGGGDIQLQAATGTYLDLHSALGSPVSRCDLDFDGLWARREEVRVERETIATLGRGDTVTLLAAEATKHGWIRLEWVAAIDALARSGGIDWSATVMRATDAGARRKLLVALAVAEKLLDTPLAEALTTAIAADRRVTSAAVAAVDLLESAPDRHSSTFARAHRRLLLESSDSPGDRVRVLLRPTDVDRAAVRLPGWLGFGYYVVRPLRLAASSLRAR